MTTAKNQKKTATIRIVALALFVVTLIVNGLAASTTLLGGVDTKAVSDAYPNLFTPAGFTFSIWSVIYTLLIGFMLRVFGVWRTKKPQLSSQDMHSVLGWFAASSVFNVLWLLAWQYQAMWLTVPLMAGLLMTLYYIHRTIAASKLSSIEALAVRAPFSVYFGWITVATVANVTVWLVSMDWSGFGIAPDIWTIAVLAVAALIGLTVALVRRDFIYLAVFVWAYWGILGEHLSQQGHAGMYPSVIQFLSFMLIILALGVLTLIVNTLGRKRL